MSERPSKAGWVAAALERYEGPLLRYATRMVGQVDRARDVVQDTFLKLCREDPARLEGRLAPWLYRVCRNQALDVRRREGRSQPLDEQDLRSRPSPLPGPARGVEAREAAQEALERLAALSASQQEVLRLKFQHDLSYRDISEVMGLSVSHVGVLIHQGLKALRRHAQPEAAPALRRAR
jgi:RNA polymerase sigma-70 factor (ECF subfamily)